MASKPKVPVYITLQSSRIEHDYWHHTQCGDSETIPSNPGTSVAGGSRVEALVIRVTVGDWTWRVG